jgi:hypothetical protein
VGRRRLELPCPWRDLLRTAYRWEAGNFYQTREDARSLLQLDGAQVELRNPAHFADVLDAAKRKKAELKAASESGAKRTRTPGSSSR